MHERVKAAKFSRDPDELYQVGLMFRDGTDVEQDFKEAKDWFRRAAYADHPGALFNLGVISVKNLVSGYSSEYEIKNWLNKAIKLEHAGAKELLGLIESGEELPEAEGLFALEGKASTSPEPQKSEPPIVERPSQPEPQVASAVAKFNKDLACATTQYQPDDLPEYDNEPWDIRISLDNAPLEDAYYFTVKDPQATTHTIQSVLEQFALNTDRSAELDTHEYPQLPHIQQELLGYYQSGKTDQTQLTIYANKRPSDAPVPLSDPVASHLSTCVFLDGTHDYKLLDLVFVVESKSLETTDLSGYQTLFGSKYILFLIDYYKRHSPKGADNANFSDTPFRPFLGGNDSSDHYPQVTKALRDAADIGWIFTEKPSNNQIFISDKGYDQIESLQKEVEDLTREYERYQSISVNPPTLGVPDGLDARIQIMRSQSVDVIRTIFLFAFIYNEEDLFGVNNWADNYESGESFSAIYDAFQYETDFAEDVITELTQL